MHRLIECPASTHSPAALPSPASHSVAVFAQAIASPTHPRFDVFWRINTRHQGLLRVSIDAVLGLSTQDARIVAELAAMQYLLEKRLALGTQPDTSKTTLVFSTGAPTRLAHHTSSKTHLALYAYFLTLRFSGATIVADKDARWITLSALKHYATLHVNGPSGECLKLPGIGPVWLTRHLLRQFRMRLNNQPYQQAWQVLERLLTTCRLQPLPVAAKTVEHDRQRHRHPGVRFYDPDSHWVFVIVQHGNRAVLTTAYIHTPSHRNKSKKESLYHGQIR